MPIFHCGGSPASLVFCRIFSSNGCFLAPNWSDCNKGPKREVDFSMIKRPTHCRELVASEGAPKGKKRRDCLVTSVDLAVSRFARTACGGCPRLTALALDLASRPDFAGLCSSIAWLLVLWRGWVWNHCFRRPIQGPLPLPLHLFHPISAHSPLPVVERRLVATGTTRPMAHWPNEILLPSGDAAIGSWPPWAGGGTDLSRRSRNHCGGLRGSGPQPPRRPPA